MTLRLCKECKKPLETNNIKNGIVWFCDNEQCQEYLNIMEKTEW